MIINDTIINHVSDYFYDFTVDNIAQNNEELLLNLLNTDNIVNEHNNELLTLSDQMISLARVKNEVTAQLNSLTKEYKKSFNIKISDYTKYPLSYFYFICQNKSHPHLSQGESYQSESYANNIYSSETLSEETYQTNIVDATIYVQKNTLSSSNKNDNVFFQLLPDFFGKNPDLALSFILNSIYSDITFSIPLKVKIFTKQQIIKIFQFAITEVLKHKELCAIYIEQFSLNYREYNDVTDSVVQQFIKDIVTRYKSILLYDFKLSCTKMLSFFAMSYPFLTVQDINQMLPTLAQNTTILLEFFQKLDSLNLQGLNTKLLDKMKSKYLLWSL